MEEWRRGGRDGESENELKDEKLVKQIYKKRLMIDSMNFSVVDHRERGECDTRVAEMDVEEVMNGVGDDVENEISV